MFASRKEIELANQQALSQAKAKDREIHILKVNAQYVHVKFFDLFLLCKLYARVCVCVRACVCVCACVRVCACACVCACEGRLKNTTSARLR